jgi:hypothetical protein
MYEQVGKAVRHFHGFRGEVWWVVTDGTNGTRSGMAKNLPLRTIASTAISAEGRRLRE